MSISMIWFEDDTRESFKDFDFIEELDLNSVININYRRKINEPKDDLRRFFTKDKRTVILRQELFLELLSKSDLYNELDESFSILSDFFEIEREKEGVPSNEKLLFSIKMLESYVLYIKKMKDIFAKYDVKSTSLKKLQNSVSEICDDTDFEQLSDIVEQKISSITNLKSITVGINLDAELRPIEAGLVSVNDDVFVSGNLIDKIFRIGTKQKQEYECMAPLVPVAGKLNQQDFNALRISVNSALNNVFSASLKQCAAIVKKYSVDRLRKLAPFVEEWKFIVSCVTPMLELKNNGFSLCISTFGNTDEINGMYHPILAINKALVVKNDLTFDESAKIYILTGPNQGGKSIYTQSAGILYSMLHLGLLLPAQRASCRMVDAILVHFIDVKKRSYQDGRLADECRKIHKINQNITENSLFLFDEALSSTNATEATAISSEIITAYSDIGARGIWTTHFHELCQLETTYKHGKSKICNICAQIEEDSHKRIFRIVKGDYGQSYAADIAGQYGLTKEDILKKISP